VAEVWQSRGLQCTSRGCAAASRPQRILLEAPQLSPCLLQPVKCLWHCGGSSCCHAWWAAPACVQRSMSAALQPHLQHHSSAASCPPHTLATTAMHMFVELAALVGLPVPKNECAGAVHAAPRHPARCVFRCAACLQCVSTSPMPASCHLSEPNVFEFAARYEWGVAHECMTLGRIALVIKQGCHTLPALLLIMQGRAGLLPRSGDAGRAPRQFAIRKQWQRRMWRCVCCGWCEQRVCQSTALHMDASMRYLGLGTPYTGVILSGAAGVRMVSAVMCRGQLLYGMNLVVPKQQGILLAGGGRGTQMLFLSSKQFC
jgi:hypothetical protein